MQYQITAVTAKPNQLYCVKLQPVQVPGMQFTAGQYVKLALPSGVSLPFSIANAPCADTHLEFIIRAQQDAENQALMEHLQGQTYIDVQGPFGQCVYQTMKSNPILLIAGGTGIAQMQAILTAALAQKDKRQWYLYWSVRDESEVELLQTKNLAQLDSFKYQVASTQAIYEWVTADFADITPFQCYLSGPWSLIDKAVAHLKQHGILVENLYSDRFALVS